MQSAYASSNSFLAASSKPLSGSICKPAGAGGGKCQSHNLARTCKKGPGLPRDPREKVPAPSKVWNRVKGVQHSAVRAPNNSKKGEEGRQSFDGKNLGQRENSFGLNGKAEHGSKLLQSARSSLSACQTLKPLQHDTASPLERLWLLRRSESFAAPKAASPAKHANEGKELVAPLAGSSIERPASELREVNNLKIDLKTQEAGLCLRKDGVLKASSSMSCINSQGRGMDKSPLTTSTNQFNTPTNKSDANRVKAKILTLSIKNLERLTMAKYAEEVIDKIKTHIQANKAIPATKMDFYKVGRLLGRGAFGKVRLGLHKLTGKLVALKSMQKAVLTSEESQKKAMQEFNALRLLRHPNVVRLYERFETEKHVVLVMELCSGEDLLTYIRSRKRLSEDAARLAFRSLVMGLNHCHSKGVVHRDIKLDNILLSGDGVPKLGDFGVACAVQEGVKTLARCGTPAYTAPEVIRGKGYGYGADVWSAGVVLYAMLYGSVPFRASSVQDLHALILKGKYSLKEDVSEDARDLIKNILEKDPRKRFSIPEILAHRWTRRPTAATSLLTREERESCREVWVDSDAASTLTEQSLESARSEQKSVAKSLVLGPFNTSLSESEVTEFVPHECDLLDKRKVIKLMGKVREADDKYEKDNNGEIDNGIYTKLIHNSNEPSDNEEEKADSEELEDDLVQDKKQFIEFNIHKTAVVGNIAL